MEDGSNFLSRFDALEERIALDPEGLKREIMAKARRDSPQLTDAQLEEHWRYAAILFDLDG